MQTSPYDVPPNTHCGKPLMKVLVVEDDEITGRIAVQLISELPAQVTLVTTAAAALECLARERWDLALIDIGLPGASGIELVRVSRHRFVGVAHVMLSSSSDAQDVIAAMRTGAEDYLVKPLSREALETLVEGLHARPRFGGSRPTERVLAVGAHPDDVEIGVGGILRRHSEEGDDVTILTLTGGEQGGDSRRRVQESTRAAEILGARLVIESLQDTMLSAGPPTIEAISGAIERWDPTIIYTHTANDVHQDHRGTHAATMIAARTVPRIYAYQAPSTNIDFRPTRFVKIDEYIDAKLDAIRAHASQAQRTYLEEDLLRSTARYWGRFAGGGLVEPLEVARHTELDVHNPRLADLDLATAFEAVS